MQKLQARDINLRYLIDNFGLQRVRNSEFFREWQENLPEVTDSEKQLLDRVQDIYSHPKSFVNFLLPPRTRGEGWGGVKNLRLLQELL
jgi:hypothetical protein